MGKKGKGKEKKERRKEDILKRNESALAVKIANEVKDPLQTLAAFQKYDRNGLELTICCKKVTNMNDDEINIAIKFVRDNMKDLYESSSWGWKEEDKRDEMTEENARYLLAVDQDHNIVAMSHFRFDLDEDIEVLYCYEIQLLGTYRRKGLGKFMMQVLELMALKCKMKKVLLTAFKANSNAVNFFQGMKYTVDETSPYYIDPLHPECYDYEIYSKVLRVR